MPWRDTKDPYAILVSEVMLQQTQVSRVLKYYEPFLQKFPDFQSLAGAKIEDVLRVWQGLGYNRRALSLRKLAGIVMEQHGGRLPRNRKELELLPGIGKGTAGALLAFAFNVPEPFIETNIRRVFIRFFFPRRKKIDDAEIMKMVARAIDHKNPREWYWALMDYGAMLGGQAMKKEGKNSNARSVHYKKQSPFSGSDRELRGKILRILLSRKEITVDFLVLETKKPHKHLEKVIAGLERDGFCSVGNGPKGKIRLSR